MTGKSSCGNSCPFASRNGRLMLVIALTAAMLFYMAVPQLAPGVNKTLPGLVIYNGMGMGGIGRLDYSEKRRAYQLLDGRFTPYVVEGENVRPMRVDEGGGTMAIPRGITSLDGAIYARLPSYNAIMKINADATIDKIAGYGPFSYAGGMETGMTPYKGVLYFFDRNTLMAYDTQLNKLGEVTIPDIGYVNDRYVITAGKLYMLQSVDTRPATDCYMPDPSNPEGGPGACGEQYTRQVVVDIADPAQMKVLQNEKRVDKTAANYSEQLGYDPETASWLSLSGTPARLQLRKADSFEQVADSMAITGNLYAITRTAPFILLRWNGERMILNTVGTDDGKITLGPDFDTGLTENNSDITMKRHDGLVYIMARSYLRIIRMGAHPDTILAQDFRDNMGDRFQVEDFAFADNLAQTPETADRDRLTAILKLKYVPHERMIELQSEIDKLTPADDWALEPLSDVLEHGGNAYNLHPVVAKGLGNLGPTAKPAIPALLNASMTGAAIRGDYVPHLAAALKHIDPDGGAVVAALPDFIANNYSAGAKSVAKQVLSALPGNAAQDALKAYR